MGSVGAGKRAKERGKTGDAKGLEKTEESKQTDVVKDAENCMCQKDKNAPFLLPNKFFHFSIIKSELSSFPYHLQVPYLLLSI